MDRTPNEDSAASLMRRIVLACDSFEKAWRDGKNPRVEDYLLACSPPDRPGLLQSLQQRQQMLILQHFERETAAPQTEAVAISGPAPLTLLKPVVHFEQRAAPDSQATQAEIPSISLRVLAGPHEGEEFNYEEHNTLLAGRSPQAQLFLKDDLHFSRYHFRLEVNPPTCFLMDLHSRNGTFVNGERVTEHFLKDGDIISGGRTKLAVSILDPRNTERSTKISEFSTSSCDKATLEIATTSTPETQVLSQKPELLPDAPEPTQFAGYRVNRQIGVGDHGTVYRATRIFSGEDCALKVMTITAGTNQKSVQVFLREASILAQLQHAHIVRMLESGSSGTELYLSTEYVDAIPWESVVARATFEQRVRTACGLISQVLSALEYAHTRSMVHRDVKPANILIFRQNGKLSAKLADFGLAKQYSNAGMSDVTREGDVIGSLPFMPPEQFINSRDARPACDIYSVGATLYWMLSGHEPILLENHPCKFLAIIEDAPVPIQKYCPKIPAPLLHLIHRALEKAPENRFHSATEMRQQLRPFLKWQSA